jgi:hypothetical protein
MGRLAIVAAKLAVIAGAGYALIGVSHLNRQDVPDWGARRAKAETKPQPRGRSASPGAEQRRAMDAACSSRTWPVHHRAGSHGNAGKRGRRGPNCRCFGHGRAPRRGLVPNGDRAGVASRKASRGHESGGGSTIQDADRAQVENSGSCETNGIPGQMGGKTTTLRQLFAASGICTVVEPDPCLARRTRQLRAKSDKLIFRKGRVLPRG